MQDTFLTEFEKRGYFSQCTDRSSLNDLMSKGKIKAYIGFDCTAPSLHVGSLMQIMCLRLLQKYGHQPIVLLGGGTTLIGDPSGKEETRKILSKKEINKNIKSIKKIFEKLLHSKNKKTKPIFVNNYDWLGKLKYIDFLRDVGKYFTINKMLTFDSVKLRLDREQSLSYTEFNYMILQAYDFYQLTKKHDCVLQLGGSDQWGNIVNGVELIRRISQKSAFGLTTPLITLSSGAKMGKTEKGAVWLDEKIFSAYEYWQFWRNTSDEDVKKFLKFFTEDDIDNLTLQIENEKDINKLKILLANKATTILHGSKAAKDSAETAKETFVRRGLGKNIPEGKIEKKIIIQGINIIELIFQNNLAQSKSEVRRILKNNGVKINDVTVNDEKKIVNIEDVQENNFIKLSIGKKNHVKVKVI